MNNIEIESIQELHAVYKTTCKKAARHLHMHNNAYEVTLFKKGNIDYFINDTTYSLQPGDLIFIRPFDIHGLFIKDNSPYERFSLHINEQIAEKLFTEKTNLLRCFQNLEENQVRHLRGADCEQFEFYMHTLIKYLKNDEYGADIRVHSYLSLLMVLINTTIQSDNQINLPDISPALIKDALSYISENLTNDISVQAIADYLNISRSRLSHVFKDYTGISLWNYIIARRIQYSQTLLKQGHSITNACYECGFQDYAHFIKVFTRLNGISPGKYARSSSMTK